jgi:hypothetical protein
MSIYLASRLCLALLEVFCLVTAQVTLCYSQMAPQAMPPRLVLLKTAQAPAANHIRTRFAFPTGGASARSKTSCAGSPALTRIGGMGVPSLAKTVSDHPAFRQEYSP